MKHKHHIIPRHMGGSDNPSNLIEVSIEEHAELHLELYLEYGKVEDWVASQSLAGMMGEEERLLELSRLGQQRSQEAMTPEGKRRREAALRTPEANAKRIASMTGQKRGKYVIHKENPGWVNAGKGRPKGSKNKNPYDSSKRLGVKRGPYKRKKL